jgi:hypothetical protein
MFTPMISSAAKPRPARILLFAPPKWGKTSWAAYAPDPIFLMTRGEDGLLTLLSYGRIPETPHFEEEALNWDAVLGYVDFLIHGKHDRKTLVVDTINGAIDLLAEAVTDGEFEGKRASYENFGRGVKVADPAVANFIEKLEVLRQRRKMSIILLAHSKAKTTKNPSGQDFDQWMTEMPDKLAGHFNKWADLIAFGSFKVSEKKSGENKVKVVGEGTRMLITGASAAHVVGNRMGLPKEILGGLDAKTTWDAFAAAMRNARPKAAAKPSDSVQPVTTPAEGQPAGEPAPADGGTTEAPPAADDGQDQATGEE